MALRKKKKQSILDNKVIAVLFNLKTLPYTASFIILTIMFVAFRMKGIEQAYEYNALEKRINNVETINKELKATRAGLLSVQKLRRIAQKYNLKEPGPEQIILIP